MREIRDFIDKAEKFLRTAEHALNIGDYDSCVSRCYYAMFFMAEAVLLTKGLSAYSHKGVISLFGEHFVKTGFFDRNLGKSLSEAFDKRLVGDYGVGFTVTEEEMSEIFKIVLTATLTVFSGTLIFVLGQIIPKLFIEPINDQHKLKGEIVDSLIRYANLYSNPAIGKPEK